MLNADFPLALREEKTGQNKVRDRDMGSMNVSFGWRRRHEADFSLKWIFCSTSSFPNFKRAVISQHRFSLLWKKKKKPLKTSECTTPLLRVCG